MHFLCTFKYFLAVFPHACLQYEERIVPETPLSSYFQNVIDGIVNHTIIPDRKVPAANVILPDTAKNSFVFLEQNTYYYENHTVTTEDGYILLTVRIPYGKSKNRTSKRKRPPVIFVHGIFCSFYDFLNAGPENAIGFQILEAGYDVWLMNSRGNTYSRRHVTLDPVLNASDFWNFSWHELGYYDVAANMDYIEKVTGFSNVSIVGHSQGGIVYLALAGSRPEYDKRITFSFQLAPVVYMKNAKQLIVKTLSDNLDLFDDLTEKFNWHEILPPNEIYTQIGHSLCHSNSPYLDVCTNFLEFIGGSSDQLNGSIVSVLCTDHPAGASIKQVTHYIQVTISDKFQLYDYGPECNKAMYNQATPPLYNLSAITSPVAIYHGKSDNFVSLTDGARLASEIPNALHFILGYNTNHLDVQWGTRAVENIFRPGIKLMNKYNNIPDGF